MKTLTFKPAKSKLTHAVALGVLALAANQANATDYAFSTLGTGVTANGMNNLGQVVGSGGGVWNGSSWSTVTNPPGTDQSFLNTINDLGQIGGYSHPTAVDAYLPERWNSATSAPTQLPDLGLPNPWATGVWSINSSGQMTGVNYDSNPNGLFFRPVTWTPDGVIHELPTLGGDGATLWYNRQINDSGVIAGASNLANGAGEHGTAWVGFAAHDLGTLGGTNSGAFGINNPGQIVGGADLANDNTHPALWTDYTSSTPIDLGTLGGAAGIARNINDQGLIVGFSDTADGKSDPTLWANGQTIDLMQYFPTAIIAAGWAPLAGSYSYSAASFIDINNAGTIIGNMCTSTACATFELTPAAVPVPGAVWLFGSALAGFMGMSRRKQAIAA